MALLRKLVLNSGQQLFRALHERDLKEARQILTKDPFAVNAKDKHGNTPLHLASGRTQIELLLSSGAEVNAVNDKGETPLHGAYDESEAESLIKAGANVNAKTKTGCTPLHTNSHEKVIALLLLAGADINAEDNNKSTPLAIKIRRLDYAAALLLVSHGARVNFSNGDLPLHQLADLNEYQENVSAELRLLKALVQAGADQTTRDKQGKTPLEIALEHSRTRPELLEILLFNHCGPLDPILLHKAIQNWDVRAVSELIKAGIDVNGTIGTAMDTPLHTTACLEHKSFFMTKTVLKDVVEETVDHHCYSVSTSSFDF